MQNIVARKSPSKIKRVEQTHLWVVELDSTRFPLRAESLAVNTIVFSRPFSWLRKTGQVTTMWCAMTDLS